MSGEDRGLDALRGAFASGSETAPPESSCPAPEAIWDAVSLRLSARDRRRVVEHLRACSSCATEWRIAAEQSGLPGADARTVPARRPTLRTLGLPLAVAALMVMGAALFLLVRQPREGQQEPSFRDGAGSGIRSLVPDNEALPRDDFVLRWAPVERDALYTIKVDRRDLTPVTVARNLDEARYQVPAEILAAVPSGETIVWRVEAHLADGRRVRSDAFLVRLE